MEQISYTLKHYIYNKNTPNQSELIALYPHKIEVKGMLFFIHGHQINDRIGAWEILRFVSPIIKEGYCILIPSMLGFGKTTGKKDMYGPETIQRLYDTLTQWLKENDNKKLIGVIGSSRGASAAALMTIKYPKLFTCAVVLAGTYDLERQYNQINLALMKKRNIEEESGIKPNDFDVRSAIKNTQAIISPFLIIHGKEDENIDFQQAVDFGETLIKFGKECQTVILSNKSHALFSNEIFEKYIIPFLRKKLK